MEISLGRKKVNFLNWYPDHGRVFTKVFAFDTETTKIDGERSWLVPAYVLGVAYDGRRGVFIERQHLHDFLLIHRHVPTVMHSAAFDLAVVHQVIPSLDIYEWVDLNRIWDTELLHRLLTLGTEGHPVMGKGRATLEHCVAHYFDIELPKDVVDSKGKPVRTSYGQWLNKPLDQIEPVYLDYAAKDALATYRLYNRLRHLLDQLVEDSEDVFGYVSPEWLREQRKKWGPQTHHIQVKASVVLREIGKAGLRVDAECVEQLRPELQDIADEKLAILRDAGYMPGKGSLKALREILRQLEMQHPDLDFPRTPSGPFQTNKQALDDLSEHIPFVKALFEYRAVEKLLSTYLKKMGKRTLHPHFYTLTRSGRTSCSDGDINAQNLPRDQRVRSCFVPPEGCVFIDLDYSTVELATLAQSVLGQLGIPSEMAATINRGVDLHTLVASHVIKKPLADVTDDERQRAKAINFGTPGGMGLDGLRSYARTSYGVDLNEEEVEKLREGWFELFPEMEDFLAQDEDLGWEVATLLELTPQGYYELAGSAKFLYHAERDGSEDLPYSPLGGMCLKAIKDPEPETANGRPYTPVELDYFWTRLETVIDKVPREYRRAIVDRRPSVGLQRAVMRLVGRAPAFTLTGRRRANATFCARHNTVFQGLAADGAKLALWEVWRAGYEIVNFIHDEFMVTVPADSNLALAAEHIRFLMCKGMSAVVPDVKTDVEYVVTDRWRKKAKLAFDERGKLTVWNPE